MEPTGRREAPPDDRLREVRNHAVLTSPACGGEPALGLDPRVAPRRTRGGGGGGACRGRPRAGRARGGGNLSADSDAASMRRHPRPSPPPQAGEGALRCKTRAMGARLNAKLLKQINAILPVQSCSQKYSAFPVGQISSTSRVF